MPNITFLGMVMNNKLPKLYSEADFFLTCADSETFGITVIEALSSDLIPILAHCPVFAELYENSPFIMNNMFKNEKELGEVLTRLATTQRSLIPAAAELRYQLRNSIFFSWPCAAEALVDQYRQLVETKKAFVG